MTRDDSKHMATILVVDDLRENVEITARLLTARGYTVADASCGEDALAMVAQGPPDAILLDVLMPGMGGLEVCRRLKGDPATRHIPIIIVTGVSDRETNVAALDAGADDFLAKPFDAVLLDARIRNSLRAKRLQDELMQYGQTLEQRIHERTAQLERTQKAAMFSLAKLSESRDPETGEHLERMRRYVLEVALGLRANGKHVDVIDDAYIDALDISSPLHDIGKVGIPDDILLKTGRLTPEEFDIMKTHSRIGGDTLKAADSAAGGESFLAMARDVAYHHHEKWDGKGYPDALRGTDIPLSARIVAVSDVYDALTSKRPYKEPMTHEHSMSIILQGRGGHFDPDIIDAFVSRETAILAARAELKDSGGLSPLQVMRDKLDALRAEQADT